MNKWGVVIFIGCFVLVTPGYVSGTVVYVPADYPTIQAAIDAVFHGDTVMVSDGTYQGSENTDLSFHGKGVTLVGENGPDAVTIDCEGYERGFIFQTHETDKTQVVGFTITNGFSDYGGAAVISYASPKFINCRFGNNHVNTGGGAVVCENSSASFTGCIFEENEVNNWENGVGGAMYCYQSTMLISNCVFLNNQVPDSDEAVGGAIYCGFGSNLTISNCAMIGNRAEGSLVASGGAISSIGSLTLTNCLFADNVSYFNGSAVYCEDNLATITNCTFSGNHTVFFSGGALGVYGAAVTLSNSILWGNTPDEVYNYYGTVNISSSDIQGGWAGSGNIDSNPQFVSTALAPYCLSQVAAGQSMDSPCLDSGGMAASEICFSLPWAEICLDELSTRTDEVVDTGNVDMGFHYFPTAFATPTPPPCINNGDPDGSGALTPEDALMAFQIYLHLIPDPNPVQYCAADCNGDGTVSPTDALCIFRHYLLNDCECSDQLR